jgi:hypothetical protein
MTLIYAELQAQRDQEAAADPAWRSPQHLGMPSRVPGAGRRKVNRTKIIRLVPDDAPTRSPHQDAA